MIRRFIRLIIKKITIYIEKEKLYHENSEEQVQFYSDHPLHPR